MARDRWHAVLLLMAVALAFLVPAAADIAAPLGDSHDGRNAAVWARGSESLREDGPVASKLGGQAETPGGTALYAHHPPLIYVETAVAEAVAGDHPAATRAPAWLGSLALIPLLYLLARALSIDPIPAAAGVAVALACPMFLDRGGMLDTPVTGLPFGVALVLAWVRADRGRAWPAVATGALAAATVLAAWQGVLLWALLVGLTLFRGRRGTGALLVGGIAGGVALAAWLQWVNGSPAEIVGQLRFRSGSGTLPTGWGEFVRSQLELWPVVWGIGSLLSIPAAVALVWDRRTRALGAALVAVVVAYTVGLRGGATIHDYWTYWWLVPLALGCAVLADAAQRRLGERGAVAAVALASALVVVGGVTGSSISAGTRSGAAAAELAVRLGDESPETVAIAGLGEPMAWLVDQTGARAVPLADSRTLAAMVRTDPATPVLLHVRAPLFGDLSCFAPTEAAERRIGDYALFRAGALAEHLACSVDERESTGSA